MRRRKRRMGRKTAAIVLTLVAVCLTASCSERKIYGEGGCRNDNPVWSAKRNAFGIEAPHYIIVNLDDEGQVYWSSKPISDNQFFQYVQSLNDLPISATLILRPSDKSDCGRVRAIRSMMHHYSGCGEQEGICGEGGDYNSWK